MLHYSLPMLCGCHFDSETGCPAAGLVAVWSSTLGVADTAGRMLSQARVKEKSQAVSSCLHISRLRCLEPTGQVKCMACLASMGTRLILTVPHKDAVLRAGCRRLMKQALELPEGHGPCL